MGRARAYACRNSSRGGCGGGFARPGRRNRNHRTVYARTGRRCETARQGATLVRTLARFLMALLLSRQIKAEVDEIWSYIAVESGSVDIADRVVDAITETFLQISRHPNLGRRRDDLRKGLRSVPSGSYVVFYRVEGNNVRIFHVVHGRRDIKAVIRQ